DTAGVATSSQPRCHQDRSCVQIAGQVDGRDSDRSLAVVLAPPCPASRSRNPVRASMRSWRALLRVVPAALSRCRWVWALTLASSVARGVGYGVRPAPAPTSEPDVDSRPAPAPSWRAFFYSACACRLHMNGPHTLAATECGWHFATP